MAKSARIKSYPQNGAFEPSYVATDWTYDNKISLVDGHWRRQCDMLVPWRSLNGTHRRTAQYKRGADRKRRRLAVEEERVFF